MTKKSPTDLGNCTLGLDPDHSVSSLENKERFREENSIEDPLPEPSKGTGGGSREAYMLIAVHACSGPSLAADPLRPHGL